MVPKTLVATLAFLLLASACSAAAAPPEFLFRTPEDGFGGAGAGRIGPPPKGLAANPVNGHIYVADYQNSRIAEFTPWGEFVRAWGWGVEDGSSELQVCGPAEPEIAPSPGLCRAGIPGAGGGQFGTQFDPLLPFALTVDSAGNVYVADGVNRRVQKFDPTGNFLLMLGADVNRTKVEEGKPEAERNLCVAGSGDVCQAGIVGTGAGEFGWNSGGVGNVIATGPKLGATETIYVGDVGRVQMFEPDGTYVGDFPDPEGLIAAQGIGSVALDPGGNLYISDIIDSVSSGNEQHVLKLGPSGSEVCALTVRNPRGIATDVSGNAYVLAGTTNHLVSNEVIEFDSACKPVIAPGSRFAATPEGVPNTGGGFIASFAIATGASCPGEDEPGGLFVTNSNHGANVSYFDSYGPPPTCFEPPPPAAPQITDSYATAVESDGAVVRAKINPRFWADTRYRVEYGTGECSSGGCPRQTPGGSGSLLTSKVVANGITTNGVLLTGLEPSTTYHYRFVAVSSGGGPAVGQEGTFTTPPLRPQPKADCANQAFRFGPGTYLPDCRGYELVTPLEKGNGDVLALSERDGFPRGLEQSSLDGDRLAYTTYRAFGDSVAAPYESEYVARRDPTAGWGTTGVNAPRKGESFLSGRRFELAYKAFSPDLSTGWLEQNTEPVLAPGVLAGFTNLYRRSNATGTYEALIHSTPPNLGNYVFAPELQGVSADGSCAVFRANDRLTDDASGAEVNNEGIPQVYETCNGQTRLVSVLPSGVASNIGSSAGTAVRVFEPDRSNSLLGAVSADGARVYWTAASTGNGALYLRNRATKPQSKVAAGKCTEPAKACTTLVSAGPARFVQASPDGSIALYTAGGKLFLFDAEAVTSTEVAGQVMGVVGASEDLSRLYFVSGAAFDGAEAGEPNLYLFEGGTIEFVAALATGDVLPGRPSLVEAQPSLRLSRVSPDGLHAAFVSSASLTGHDNADAQTGDPVAEVFLYSAAAEQLVCVSCNPTGARPSGRQLRVEAKVSLVRAAAQIPGFKTVFYAPRVLSEDGSRLFFESFEALVPGDTNGKQDVYEWQRAQSAADCEKAGAELYVAASSGCLALISSGQSSEDSDFVDASPSGDDVFIRTGESLVEHDPGLIDIYDARVEGGFPSPSRRPPECEGQACQGAAPAPDFGVPASAAFAGPGNFAAKPRKRCGKGRHTVRRRGKVRCVSAGGKQAKRKGAKRKGERHRSSQDRRGSR